MLYLFKYVFSFRFVDSFVGLFNEFFSRPLKGWIAKYIPKGERHMIRLLDGTYIYAICIHVCSCTKICICTLYIATLVTILICSSTFISEAKEGLGLVPLNSLSTITCRKREETLNIKIDPCYFLQMNRWSMIIGRNGLHYSWSKVREFSPYTKKLAMNVED